MRVQRVLVVDDCKPTVNACVAALGDRAAAVAHTAGDARLYVARQTFDLAIMDQRLGPGSMFGIGLRLVEEFKQARPEMHVVLVLTEEVERIALLNGATLALPKTERDGASVIPVDVILDHFENGTRVAPRAADLRLEAVLRDYTLDVVRRCDGTIKRAARALGVARWTLTRQLGELLQIERRGEDPASHQAKDQR